MFKPSSGLAEAQRLTADGPGILTDSLARTANALALVSIAESLELLAHLEREKML